jgi:hypothetical protein
MRGRGRGRWHCGMEDLNVIRKMKNFGYICFKFNIELIKN